jgi:hypothetical protein
MQVSEQAAERHIAQDPPDWVADWWMPATEAAALDADLAALLDPEPPRAIQVMGRPREAEPAAACR